MLSWQHKLHSRHKAPGRVLRGERRLTKSAGRNAPCPSVLSRGVAHQREPCAGRCRAPLEQHTLRAESDHDPRLRVRPVASGCAEQLGDVDPHVQRRPDVAGAGRTTVVVAVGMHCRAEHAFDWNARVLGLAMMGRRSELAALEISDVTETADGIEVLHAAPRLRPASRLSPAISHRPGEAEHRGALWYVVTGARGRGVRNPIPGLGRVDAPVEPGHALPKLGVRPLPHGGVV